MLRHKPALLALLFLSMQNLSQQRKRKQPPFLVLICLMEGFGLGLRLQERKSDTFITGRCSQEHTIHIIAGLCSLQTLGTSFRVVWTDIILNLFRQICECIWRIPGLLRSELPHSVDPEYHRVSGSPSLMVMFRSLILFQMDWRCPDMFYVFDGSGYRETF